MRESDTWQRLTSFNSRMSKYNGCEVSQLLRLLSSLQEQPLRSRVLARMRECRSNA